MISDYMKKNGVPSEISISVKLSKPVDKEYEDGANDLKRSFGLRGSINDIKKKLVQMVVSAGNRFVLRTGFKSGFVLRTAEQSTARQLIKDILRYTEHPKGGAGDGGGVTAADLAGCSPEQKDRMLCYLLGESLAMNLALRQSMEETFSQVSDLNQLAKVFAEHLQQNKQWSLGETVLLTIQQNLKNQQGMTQ